MFNNSKVCECHKFSVKFFCPLLECKCRKLLCRMCRVEHLKQYPEVPIQLLSCDEDDSSEEQEEDEEEQEEEEGKEKEKKEKKQKKKKEKESNKSSSVPDSEIKNQVIEFPEDFEKALLQQLSEIKEKVERPSNQNLAQMEELIPYYYHLHEQKGQYNESLSFTKVLLKNGVAQYYLYFQNKNGVIKAKQLLQDLSYRKQLAEEEQKISEEIIVKANHMAKKSQIYNLNTLFQKYLKDDGA